MPCSSRAQTRAARLVTSYGSIPDLGHLVGTVSGKYAKLQKHSTF